MAHAIHPGGVQGRLLRYNFLPQKVISMFEKWMYWDAEQAALTVLQPLVHDKCGMVEDSSGRVRSRYFVPVGREWQSSMMSRRPHLAEDLWVWSEELVHKVVAAQDVLRRVTERKRAGQAAASKAQAPNPNSAEGQEALHKQAFEDMRNKHSAMIDKVRQTADRIKSQHSAMAELRMEELRKSQAKAPV